MKDEKFEDMLENWASQEMKSAPQLRPKKEMYHMVEAKKQKVLFPVFMRWATVGVAAAAIIMVAILYPEYYPSRLFRPSSRQEDLSEKLQKPEAEVSKRGVPPASLGEPAKPVEPATEGRILEKSMMQHVEEPKKEAISHQKKDMLIAQSPMPPPQDLADETVGQSARKIPAPGTEYRATSETFKSKAVSTLTAPDTETEKESDADRIFANGQTISPAEFLSDKVRAGVQHVGSKTFRLNNNVWEDTEHSQKKQLITIKRDSQAYQDLIAAIPELKDYAAIGQKVIVNFGNYSLEIAENGKTVLTNEELQQFIQQ